MSGIYPQFLHVYKTEAACKHLVAVVYSPTELAWRVWHAGVLVAELTDPPALPHVEREVFVRILRVAHEAAIDKAESIRPMVEGVPKS